MSTPIKAGDLCEVIGGLTGANSPNLGLIVRVLQLRGQHSWLGNIWRCEAEYAVQAQPGINVPPGTTDFAQQWLKKIEPPTESTNTTVSKEITA
jgi:hypothetical protein